MLHRISVRLTASDSEDIREYLRERGFVIYLQNRLTQETVPMEGTQMKLFYDNDLEEFICFYNGDKSFEEMLFIVKRLEKEPACKHVDIEGYR